MSNGHVRRNGVTTTLNHAYCTSITFQKKCMHTRLQCSCITTSAVVVTDMHLASFTIPHGQLKICSCIPYDISQIAAMHGFSKHLQLQIATKMLVMATMQWLRSAHCGPYSMPDVRHAPLSSQAKTLSLQGVVRFDSSKKIKTSRVIIFILKS